MLEVEQGKLDKHAMACHSHEFNFVPCSFSVFDLFGLAAQEILNSVVQRKCLLVQVADLEAHSWIYSSLSLAIMLNSLSAACAILLDGDRCKSFLFVCLTRLPVSFILKCFVFDVDKMFRVFKEYLDVMKFRRKHIRMVMLKAYKNYMYVLECIS